MQLVDDCICYYHECMDLRTWLDGERGRNARLATRLGVAPGYLSQMADGKRPIPYTAWQSIADETGQQVLRWDLWPTEWHEIWPQLKKAKGAPPIPAPEAATAGEG